jgi:DnaJ-domain-containing protein 1
VGLAGEALQTPCVAFCDVRQRLLQNVAVAVSELVAIQNEHLEAIIISGEPNSDGYDERLRKATAIKNERKRAFMAHVKEHGG